MKQHSKRALLANAFGTLGYFFCILAWGWAVLLYLPAVLENKYVEDYLLPTPVEEAPAEPIAVEASPAIMIFAIVVTIVVIVATILVFIKIPSTVAKTGKTVTAKAADTAVPIITRGHPLPPAKKKRLTVNLIKLAKLLLVLLPFVVTLFTTFIELPLPYEVTILVSSTLALFSLAWFSAQYIFARLLKVDPVNLV